MITLAIASRVYECKFRIQLVENGALCSVRESIDLMFRLTGGSIVVAVATLAIFIQVAPIIGIDRGSPVVASKSR